jgi:predicted DNA-binding protein (MmcQ/YjbR family)
VMREKELKALLRNSYELVFAKLPQKIKTKLN